jgi:hypothetical protein
MFGDSGSYSMKNKVQTTLHIPEKVRDRFKEIVTAQNLDMGSVAEVLMAQYIDQHSAHPRSDRVEIDHATQLLATAVRDQLSRDTTWATEAIIAAGMGLPGTTVFNRRIGHFSSEKQELGRRLAQWILLRAINYADRGQKVFLVCDSGTTVFWLLNALGEVIETHFSKPNRKANTIENVSIVTNNIPGAESFVTYAAAHKLDSGRKRICDVVKCRLLGGIFLPEYVAVTGKDTNRDLETLAKEERLASQTKLKVRGETGKAGAVFIGITTGNWIAIGLEDKLPHLLARGLGHGAFKETLLKTCDETFVIGPLGKVLLQGDDAKDLQAEVNNLNKLLKYSPKATDPQELSYELVPMSPDKSDCIKLVSTLRAKESILRDHSALVRKRLGEPMTLDLSDTKMVDLSAARISAVRHLIFPFDPFFGETFETQLENELPHARTREPEVRGKLFLIK